MSTESNYFGVLLRLLPKGKLWRFGAESDQYRFLSSFAPELARVDARVQQLLKEMDPAQATETFEQWEDDYGMALDCGGLSDTMEQRRSDLMAKIISLGGQSEDYFLSFFDASDGDVTITYPEVTAVAGVSCGGPVDYPNLYTWRINLPEGDIDYFEAGDMAGEPLVQGKHTTKICLIQKYKPANTHVYFTYEE